MRGNYRPLAAAHRRALLLYGPLVWLRMLPEAMGNLSKCPLAGYESCSTTKIPKSVKRKSERRLFLLNGTNIVGKHGAKRCPRPCDPTCSSSMDLSILP